MHEIRLCVATLADGETCKSFEFVEDFATPEHAAWRLLADCKRDGHNAVIVTRMTSSQPYAPGRKSQDNG